MIKSEYFDDKSADWDDDKKLPPGKKSLFAYKSFY